MRLRKTGIWGSDVHFFAGDRLLDEATIIGHEGLGEIELLGKGVHHRFIGERVVIEPNIPCGKCRYCLQGKGNICINKRVIGVNEPGCFAEYICLPEAFCHGLPDTIWRCLVFFLMQDLVSLPGFFFFLSPCFCPH